MKRLLIDIGNTRSKLAWSERGRVGEQWALPNSELTAQLRQQLLTQERPGCIALACVADNALTDSIRQLSQQAGWRLITVQTEKQRLGVTNSYQDVSLMGIDRWLAMIGAWQQCQRPLLVLDLGTALTADVVDGSGQHLGGWIVPGFEMMLQSLEGKTSRVFRGDTAQLSTGFGQDTGSCLQQGCRAALLACMQLAVSRAEAELGTMPKIFLTGGGLMELPASELTHLAAGAEVRGELVLEGLAACAQSILLT